MLYDPALPTDRDLWKLARIGSREGVLSIYLAFDPAGGERRDPGAALHDALERAARTPFALGHPERFEAERARVLHELADYRVSGRGLVVFSCAPRALWQVYELQVRVPTLARFAERPVIAALAAVLDEHERYLVVVVDKEQARLMTVYLGRIEHETRITDDYPGRTAAGGWSQARYARHREDHLHRHLLHVVEVLRREARRQPFDRLILGGPPEAAHGLRAVLPAGLRARVVGLFPGELFARESEVLERVQRLEEAAERQAEQALVARLIEAGRDAGPAALGWNETLQALGEGRVHKLVRAEGITRRGRVCPTGHFAAVEAIARCPICGARTDGRLDLAEWAVERAYDTDASVEEVRAAAARALRREGGIGAVLRY